MFCSTLIGFGLVMTEVLEGLTLLILEDFLMGSVSNGATIQVVLKFMFTSIHMSCLTWWGFDVIILDIIFIAKNVGRNRTGG